MNLYPPWNCCATRLKPRLKSSKTLALADAQWLFFDNALKARAAAAPRAASDVFVTSENLLQVMDRVTSHVRQHS